MNVTPEAFARVLECCKNPPKPSQALLDLIRNGRAALKGETYVR